ncbi:DUF3925 family protein [Ectobacillus panaciterrae]|uniref:DUF3925 family protein n=1 Tax=Ectobacillus panaciterrae TaxID=363872 RepID=UPI00048B67DF|nr:DUF3925 family protein [Ectobacillus panaciterrae]
MKHVQQETLSDREFYFVLYIITLLILGWFMDVNHMFVSKWFNLAGMILIPTIGGIAGYFVMKLGKRTQN